ncbi:MAG: hypothetical protein ABWJ99_02630 [Caldimicrobium sp.]
MLELLFQGWSYEEIPENYTLQNKLIYKNVNLIRLTFFCKP